MAQTVEAMLEQAPHAAVIVLAVAVGLGLVLWLLGRRLVRPAVVLCGLVTGATVGAMVTASFWSDDALMVGLVTGGAALAGALLAAVLFRFWMALSGAVVLALLAPLAVLVWQGTTMPSVQGLDEAMRANTAAAVKQGAAELGAGAGLDTGPASLGATGLIDEKTRQELADKARQGMRDAADSLWTRNEQAVKDWWAQTDEATRKLLYTGAVMGAVAGLLLGLGLPYTMASLQTAAVGTVLMLLPGRELLDRYRPDWSGYLPSTPEQLGLAISLITVVGVAVQWTLLRRRTEKR